MKYYIATALKNAKNHNIVRDGLNKLGHEITYDWTTHGSVKHKGKEVLREKGNLEQKGIEEANFVVVLLPGGRGTHTELGMAIALGKKVIIWCSEEDKYFFEACDKTCIFYHLEEVDRVVGRFEELPSIINNILWDKDWW